LHHSPKKSPGRNHSGNGVYWYGIHIHHIALGVASIGTVVLFLLVSQQQM
jgi:hypothetical protein